MRPPWHCVSAYYFLRCRQRRALSSAAFLISTTTLDYSSLVSSPARLLAADSLSIGSLFICRTGSRPLTRSCLRFWRQGFLLHSPARDALRFERKDMQIL